MAVKAEKCVIIGFAHLVKQIRRKWRSCTWFSCVLSWSNINLLPVVNSSQRCSPKVPAGKRIDIPGGLLVLLRSGRRAVREGMCPSLWKTGEHRTGCKFLWGPSHRVLRSASSTTTQHQIHSPGKLLKLLTWRTGRSSHQELQLHLLLHPSDGELSKQESAYTIGNILFSQPFSGPNSKLGSTSLTYGLRLFNLDFAGRGPHGSHVAESSLPVAPMRCLPKSAQQQLPISFPGRCWSSAPLKIWAFGAFKHT